MNKIGGLNSNDHQVKHSSLYQKGNTALPSRITALWELLQWQYAPPLWESGLLVKCIQAQGCSPGFVHVPDNEHLLAPSHLPPPPPAKEFFPSRKGSQPQLRPLCIPGRKSLWFILPAGLPYLWVMKDNLKCIARAAFYLPDWRLSGHGQNNGRGILVISIFCFFYI